MNHRPSLAHRGRSNNLLQLTTETGGDCQLSLESKSRLNHNKVLQCVSFTSTLPICGRHFGHAFSSFLLHHKMTGGGGCELPVTEFVKKHEFRKRKLGAVSSWKFLQANNSSRLGYACHDAGPPAVAEPEVPAGGAEGQSGGKRREESRKKRGERRVSVEGVSSG